MLSVKTDFPDTSHRQATEKLAYSTLLGDFYKFYLLIAGKRINKVFNISDKNVFFQSGAGIVYDSDPTKEFEETVSKAKAINKAIDLAENGLVK